MSESGFHDNGLFAMFSLLKLKTPFAFGKFSIVVLLFCIVTENRKQYL